MDHRVYSIDSQNGQENWQTEDLGGSIVGIPAFNPEGVLYAGTFASEMLAIDAHNGQVIWRRPTNDWVWGGPVLQDDRVLVVDAEAIEMPADRSFLVLKALLPLHIRGVAQVDDDDTDEHATHNPPPPGDRERRS